MNQVRIRALGPCSIEIDGHLTSHFLPAKAIGVIAFLAIEGSSSRSRLADLLWGSLGNEQARANLRLALTRIRAGVPGLVCADRDQLSLDANARLDVDVLRLHELDAQLATAATDALDAMLAELRGPLLADLELREADGFEQWLRGQRERARDAAIRLAQTLASRHERAGALGAAIDATRRWVGLATGDEQAHLELMRRYMAAGRRSAALAQYEVLRQSLLEEFGARPSPQSYELYRRIHSSVGESAGAESASRGSAGGGSAGNESATGESPGHESASVESRGDESRGDESREVATVAPVVTELRGRQALIESIERRLLDADCRILTLLGPGGIGKTRLAQALMSRLGGRFDQPPIWVSVPSPARAADASDDSPMLHALIGAWPAGDRRGSPATRESVGRALANGTRLVVLDNLESVPDCAAFIEELAHEMPAGSRILTTSRIRLRCRDEWIGTVPGLDCSARSTEELESQALSHAARLYVRQALRVGIDTDLDADVESIEAIVGLLDGNPLAIEMAASWRRILSAVQIRARLAADPGGLYASATTETSEAGARLRRILDESWQMLPDRLRQACQQLAVLDAPFDADIAEQVLLVSPAETAALADACWLRADADGRWTLHALHRAYARQQRSQHPPDPRTEVLDGLARYFERELDLERPASQRVALVVAQQRNLRQALEACAQLQHIDLLDRLAQRCWRVWSGAALFHAAIDTLPLLVEQRGLPRWRRAWWAMQLAEARYQVQGGAVTIETIQSALALIGWSDPAQLGWTLGHLGLIRATARGQGPADVPAERLDEFRLALLASLARYGQLQAFAGERGEVGSLIACLVGMGRTRDPDLRGLRSYIMLGTLQPLGSRRVLLHLASRIQARLAPASQSKYVAIAHQAVSLIRYQCAELPTTSSDVQAVALALADQGQLRNRFESESIRAKVLMLSGRFAEAAQVFDALVTEAGNRGNAMGEHWGLIGLIEVDRRLNRLEPRQTDQMLERAGELMRQTESVDVAYTIRWSGQRSLQHLRDGEHTAALELLSAIVRVLDRNLYMGMWAIEGLDALMRACIQLLDCPSATAQADRRRVTTALLRHGMKHGRRFAGALPRMLLLRGAIRLHESAASTARRDFARALALSRRFSLPVEEATALEALGKLDEARSIYSRLGSTGDLARLHERHALMPG